MDKNISAFLLLIALLTVQFHCIECEKWWRIVTTGDAVFNPENTEFPVDQNCCNASIFSEILNPHQIKLCRHDRNDKLLSTISIGVLQALHECQKLFKDRPWNCSVFESGPYLGKFIEKGTRETAFLNAIVSAGIVREVSRKCNDQSLEWCTCDFSVPVDQLEPVDATIVPACGDDYNYGTQLAKQFTDTELKDNSCTGQTALHNNKVGRQLVNDKTKVNCICHGLTGSCSVMTCYKEVPDIEEIGQQLLKKYDEAKHIKKNITKLIPDDSSPSSSELAYCRLSPNFCQRNLKHGVYGTSGRQCWPDKSGPSNCSEMCCGGEVEQRAVLEDVEDCYFVWCCSVKCKKRKQVHSIQHFCK